MGGGGLGLQFADALRGNHGKAWTSYKTDAWGANELDPVAGQKHVNGLFGGEEVGATIVDSLDTLKLMGLEDELASGRVKHGPSNHFVATTPEQPLSSNHPWQPSLATISGNHPWRPLPSNQLGRLQ